MKLNFTKMQGAGNDYIYIDCRAAGLPPDAAAWAVQLSRRHFSVGADGVIYLCPPLRADGDAAMRMFNADGSEGVMCGNGVRCAAEFLYTHGVRRDCIRIDTPSAGQRTPLPHMAPREPSALYISMAKSPAHPGLTQMSPSAPTPKCRSLSVFASRGSSGGSPSRQLRKR